jgi:hypothetical protein
MSDGWDTLLLRALGILLGLAVGVGPCLLVYWGLTRWDARRWRQREAAFQRQQEVRAQLRELEHQLWLESLPDWQREALEAADRTRVAITREARRRLGLPEDEEARRC